MNNIYCIRHGYSFHNQLGKQYGEQAYLMPECENSYLLQDGIDQAKQLRKDSLEQLKNMDVVLVSSLTRALETADILFKNLDKQIIVLDILKEFPNGLETPNKRLTTSQLKIKFPNFDFSTLQCEEDFTWIPERYETKEELIYRINLFKRYLNTFKNKNICVVGHTDFISQLLYDEIKDLKHCHIYKL